MNQFWLNYGNPYTWGKNGYVTLIEDMISVSVGEQELYYWT